MHLILPLLFLVISLNVRAEDGFEEFKSSSYDPPPSLLFTPSLGSEVVERSLNPLYYARAELGERQTGPCPYPVRCSPRTCCPAGTNCCGAGLTCCPTNANCVSGGSRCCPKNAQTCGGRFCLDAGAVCCGNTACPPNTVCNTLGETQCCPTGLRLCPGACCPSGSQCGSGPGYCAGRPPASSVVQLSTVRPTSIRPSSVIPTSVRPTSTSSALCSLGMVKRGDGYPLDIQRRQNLQPKCTYECHHGKNIPVVEVSNIAGRTDQLFFSMCSGILNTGAARGGDGRNFDILKYGGDGRQAKQARRRDSNCRGYCAEQKLVFNDPARLECDEYPPAMSSDGGTGAHRVCIPSSQNAGEQGRLLGDFVRNCKPPPGSDFMVRMKGGCGVRALKERDALDGSLTLKRQSDSQSLNETFEASSSELRTSTKSSFIYLPFQDLRNGHYRVDLRFQGDVQGFSVIDSDGDAFFSSGAVVDGNTIEFDVDEVDDDDPLPAALIIDTAKSINVSYVATPTLANASTEPQPTSSARRMAVGSSWFSTLLMLYIIILVV